MNTAKRVSKVYKKKKKKCPHALEEFARVVWKVDEVERMYSPYWEEPVGGGKK